MKGSCLCRAVSVHAPDTHGVGACHCGMCRKWGGGPLLAVQGGKDVRFDGAEHITRYASSAWAERGFCRTCGTHLFSFVKPTGDYYLPAGLFDEQAGFKLEEQIFIDRNPGYYSFAQETKNLTEQEFMAQYGG